MSDIIRLDSQQWFGLKLAPVLGARKAKYQGMKVEYKLIRLEGQVASHEYIVSGPKLKAIGLEPVAFRFSVNEDPEQAADFLWAMATGQLAPSCWAYLIGPVSQWMIKTGQRPGFRALIPAAPGKEKDTPTDKLEKDFDKEVAIDDDVKRVAKKRDFDPSYVESVLSERPHLLGPDGAKL